MRELSVRILEKKRKGRKRVGFERDYGPLMQVTALTPSGILPFRALRVLGRN
jgi:hypothetical protein